MERILQVHNYYGSAAPSGENIVVDRERMLLEDAGHAVTTFTRFSDTVRDMGPWGKMLNRSIDTVEPCRRAIYIIRRFVTRLILFMSTIPSR